MNDNAVIQVLHCFLCYMLIVTLCTFLDSSCSQPLHQCGQCYGHLDEVVGNDNDVIQVFPCLLCYTLIVTLFLTQVVPYQYISVASVMATLT